MKRDDIVFPDPTPNHAASPSPRRRLRRAASGLMALEPRLMFDGAAAIDVAHAAADTSAVAPAADQPAAVEVRAADASLNDGKKEAVVVDTSVADYQTLEAGVGAGIAIIEFDGSRDGLAQIAKWAEAQCGYDAIHVLSHGSEATLNLGTRMLTDTALTTADTQAELAAVGQALTPDGDLLLYGCNIAAGENGTQFIADLAAATGADVAASVDSTGTAGFGGDWVLEYAYGTVGAASLSIADYHALLLSATFDYESGTGTISGQDTATLTQVNSAAGETLQVVATNDTIGSVVTSWAEPALAGSDSFTTESSNFFIESAITFSLTSGKLFDLGSIIIGDLEGSAETLTFTSSKGSTTVSLPAYSGGVLSGTTYSLGAETVLQGITSFTITTNDGTLFFAFDNVTLDNIHSPGPTFTSSTSANFAENGTGTAYDADATASSGGGTVSYSISGGVDAALFSIDSGTGVVTFGSAPNYEAPADSGGNNVYDITVTATDLNGSTNQNVAITVTNVNEAPSVTSAATASVAENTTGTVYTATGTDPDTGQTLTWSISGTDAALFSIDSGTGAVTFNTAPDYESPADSGGNNVYDITVTATDNGTGTLTDSKAVAITVTNVNEAPVNTVPGAQTTLEDAALVFSSGNGNALSVADQDAGTTLTTVVSVAGGTGTLTVTTGGGGAITGNGSNSVQIVGTAAQVNAALASVSYSPTADANGAGYATLTLSTTDDGAGTLNDTDTVTLNVTAVNDVPSFTKGADQTVSEDAGAQTVSGWATSLDKGASNESGQTLSFNVSNDNNSLFSAQPAIDASGNLTYTPAANASGSATVTVAIHDDGGTSNGGVDTSADQTFTITVNAVNDAPTVTTPASVSVTEDVAGAVTGISFADIDAGGASVTATLSVGSGTLAATSGGGVTVGGSGTATLTLAGTVANINTFIAGSNVTFTTASNATSSVTLTAAIDGRGTTTLTLTGTVANINTFIAGSNVSFTTASNATSSVTLTAAIDDGGNTGSGGALTDSDTTTINVTAVNDAPTVTTPASVSVTEDVAGAVTGISFADIDAGGASVTATLSVGSGTLAAVSGGSVTVGGSGSDTLTLTGTVANINAFIAGSNVSFTTASNATSSVTLTAAINDGGNTGSGGALTDSDTTTINVTAVNDAPTLTNLNGDSVSFSIGGSAVVLDSGSNATVADVDSTDFNGGNVTVSIVANGQAGEDVLGIENQGSGAGQIGVSGSNVSYGGTVIGTYSGGSGGADLVASLNSNATPAAVQALVRALTYFDSDSGTVNTATRTVRIAVNDGDGGTSSNQDVSVTLVRAPILNLDTGAAGSGASASFVEDGGAIAVTGTTSASDDGTFKSLTVTLTNHPDGASESLSSSYGSGAQTVSGEAVTISAYNSGTGVLTISVDDGSATAAVMQLLMESIRYNNSSNTPDTTNRTITFAATDNDDNVGSSVTSTVSVAATNDAPTVAANTGLTVTEGATGTTITTTELSITDVDTAATGLTLTVGTAPGNGTLYKSGVALPAGGTFTQDDLANNRITYSHDGSETTTDSFSFTVSDGAGGSIGSTTFSIAVTPANDVPVVSGIAGDSLAYLMGSSAQVIDQGTAAAVADVDSANFDTGTLTVAIVANRVAGEDVLAIRNQGTGAYQIGVSGGNVSYEGTTIGTYTGGSGTNDLVVTFNASATPTAVSALLKNITYLNSDSVTATESTRTVRFVVTDGDGGTSANSDASVTVSRNTPPTATDGSVPVAGNGSVAFAAADFHFSDADVGDSLQQVTIVTLPATGSLTLDGTAVTAGQAVAVADIAAGKLVFTPAANADGETSFTFRVNDGSSDSVAAYTETIVITAVNEVPAVVPAEPPLVEPTEAPAAEPAETAEPLPAPAVFLPPASELAAPAAGALSPLPGIDTSSSSATSPAPVLGGELPSPTGLTQASDGGFPVVVVEQPALNGARLFVNHGVADYAVAASGQVAITVPADAFAHTDAEAVVWLEARLADGRPLPPWIEFDPRTGKFMVNAPSGVVGRLAIRLVARDAEGHAAATVFHVRVGRAGAAQLDLPNGLGLSAQIRLAARHAEVERLVADSQGSGVRA